FLEDDPRSESWEFGALVSRFGESTTNSSSPLPISSCYHLFVPDSSKRHLVTNSLQYFVGSYYSHHSPEVNPSFFDYMFETLPFSEFLPDARVPRVEVICPQPRRALKATSSVLDWVEDFGSEAKG
ncbi:hypothetical protein GW17_00031980, partial [Ensete ventricosum]